MGLPTTASQRIAETAGGVPGPARNLVDLFEATAAREGPRIASRDKRSGSWVDTSWRELGRRARLLADGLAALGVEPGDRVAILGDSSTHWIVADLAILGAAGVCVPVYPSNKSGECRYILSDSGASFVFCDREAQVEKIREVKDALPRLRGLIRFEGTPRDGFEHSLEELERAGEVFRMDHEEAHAVRVASLTRDDPACFIYTSGTTGNPKGVVLTHGNWVYEAGALGPLGLVRREDVVLWFLPLAHSFAKVMEALWFANGATAAFVESIDKIVANAGEVHPTTMPSVPRIFEKAYNAAVSKGLAAGGLKGALFAWALKGLDEHVEALARGKARARSLALALGRRLVFPKVGAALSELFGGRIRLFISGGAPLSPKIAWFFRLAGFEILEGYGLTESSAGTFVNPPGQARIGTVGPPVPGTEVRIAEDGEILIRGPGVMREYFQNPAATSEVLKEGWLYTGDIGKLDEDGYLTITDRKKDIIVTAGGKNVAPQNLENELKADPLVSQVMVHGDGRKFLSALITLNVENVRAWARENGFSLEEALDEDERVRARIAQALDTVNARQASYATIKKFALLSREFTQESGELTPTLKVKRKFCTQKYRELLDAFYAE